MFGVGTGELIAILAIAVLVVGPERMVEFARQAGKFIGQFRQQTDSVTKEFREAFSLELDDEDESEAKESKPDTKRAVQEEPSLVTAPDGSEGGATDIPEQAPLDLKEELAAALVDGEIEVMPSEEDNTGASALWDEEDEDMAEQIEPVLVQIAELVPEDEEVEPTVIETAVLVADEGESDIAENDRSENEG